MKVLKVIDIVEKCLKENDKARNSDWILYRDVCKKMNINISNISVEEMCNNINDFPAFESVSRARRKIQEYGLYPATDKVRKFRKLNEIAVREEMLSC